MNKCIICGEDSGKGRTCGPAHRKVLQRRNASVTPETSTVTNVTSTPSVTMTPEGPRLEVPANYGQFNCECQHCKQTKPRRERGMTLNHGAYKTSAELGEHERNRLALPGDVDYEGVCKPAQEIAV